jgi:hypothetical protein
VIRFDEVKQFIFRDDFLWDVTEFHTYVFRAFERNVEVKVRNVHCHGLCARHQNETVEENLGDQHAGSGRGDLAWIVDAVAANDKASTIRFLLFRADSAHKLPICDIFESIFGDVVPVDKVYSVGAFNAVTHTIHHTTEFICRGLGPIGVVIGMAEKLAIVEELASSLVENGEGLVNFLGIPPYSLGYNGLGFGDTRWCGTGPCAESERCLESGLGSSL